MKKAIIIPTHERGALFLNDLLESLQGCKYPIIIHYNTNERNEFEMGAVRIGKELEIDEFILLPDSVVIKDQVILDMFFEQEGSVSLDLHYLSYVGKYRLEILNQLNVPDVRTKKDAWKQEFDFHNEYCMIEAPLKLFPGFWNHTDIYEEKHGRKNLINENDYIIKYKGCWTADHIYNYEGIHGKEN